MKAQAGVALYRRLQALGILTAALQLASRNGRTLRDKDLQDVNALSRRFGLPRPT
jgi:hypothetical protein